VAKKIEQEHGGAINRFEKGEPFGQPRKGATEERRNSAKGTLLRRA